MTSIAQNIDRVRETIAAACARSRRSMDAVTLLAVSKTHPPQTVLEALEAGLQHFGENRVEEAEIKIPEVNQRAATPITWHMVGHIQSRKARQIPPLFQMVHSIDRLKIAARLSELMVAEKRLLDVLLEVNVSGEASKSGFNAVGWQHDAQVRETLWQEVRQILALPGLRVCGLMTMAPIVSDMQQARPVFADLAALRAELVGSLGCDLPHLSMGMTDDYPVAIEEGATIVRIGRAIFGPREE
jgi:pyridoxal phosphate enzyme (YggS family)